MHLIYIEGHHPSDSGETAWQGMANPPQYIEQKENMKTKKYKIQKNVPIPENSGEFAGAVSQLGSGDSFEFDSNQRANCYSAAKYRDIKVTIRKISDDKCRVWRLD